ncbi:tetratricopeptide repeat protein [Lactobacillus sp. ESL0681]|uniref:tetratricopeptide repeat protein n=1 Tax=Lactobacillus sp. ESL0681 TaxID=2983211 RepID=UPI0023FA1209|nr:tetratricopeptide repeat protein [Lactobacillus sp. ESL0681]WEV40620.1 tetratricopeptide repeat protein [Lactobacillus sp. ESL0681]
MPSPSQENLFKLALKSEAAGEFKQAIDYLEQALQLKRTQKIVLQLCELYLEDSEPYAAYALIKEETDLFTDSALFDEYRKVLQANHFVIEALELQNLSSDKIAISITAIDQTVQQEIMRDFRQKKQISQYDYEQLFKLDLTNFKTFAQSLLLDPSLLFAVRISLCEDLVRLGVTESIKVLIMGNLEEFIPQTTELLEKGSIYQEVVSAIGSRYYHRPNQLPSVLGEVNLVLGSLYPKLHKYIDEPDSFASDLASYLENHDGRGHQQLFDQIYQNLPK